MEQTALDTGPFIPLENSEKEIPDVVFPPLPPMVPVSMEDIRPEDAIDRSVPSLDDLREGKIDTMEDRSETLGHFWETKDPITVHLPSNDSVSKTLPLSSFAYI